MPILAKSNQGANAIAARDYPSIEEGNDSFPIGNYEIDTSPADTPTSFLLRHAIKNAPLVERLLSDGSAVYACAVTSPRSGYRDFRTSENSVQEVQWDLNMLGEPPYFTPMVVVRDSQHLELDADRDGVHQDWHGLQVVFPKGACIALVPVFHLIPPGIQGLIVLHTDEELNPGQFWVDGVESDTFRFNVFCHRDLRRFLQSRNRANGRRGDVMTAIVTSCFAWLQNRFGRSDESEDSDPDGAENWESYIQLRTISEELKARNGVDWTDDNFCPARAATMLHPIAPFADEEADDDV